MVNLSKQIINLRVFGSVARGDSTSTSDLDIIAILKKNNKPSDESVKKYVSTLYNNKECSISWYSYNRIKRMYRDGGLFAWHLFLESENIMPIQQKDTFELLGKPADYTSYHEDIDSLIEILLPVEYSIIKFPRNAIYEAGLIYICAKNIALSASWFTDNGLDFSRYSPYNLDFKNIIFTINKSDYELLIQARNSSMRGMNLPKIEIKNLIKQQREILTWARKIKKNIKEVKKPCLNPLVKDSKGVLK